MCVFKTNFKVVRHQEHMLFSMDMSKMGTFKNLYAIVAKKELQL